MTFGVQVRCCVLFPKFWFSILWLFSYSETWISNDTSTFIYAFYPSTYLLFKTNITLTTRPSECFLGFMCNFFFFFNSWNIYLLRMDIVLFFSVFLKLFLLWVNIIPIWYAIRLICFYFILGFAFLCFWMCHKFTSFKRKIQLTSSLGKILLLYLPPPCRPLTPVCNYVLVRKTFIALSKNKQIDMKRF